MADETLTVESQGSVGARKNSSEASLQMLAVSDIVAILCSRECVLIKKRRV